VVTTILRFANVVGGELETPLTRVLDAPFVPSILGYDQRMQFVHTEDVVGALDYCVERDVPGIYNVAGDGVVPWSEVMTRLRKPRLILPPVATSLVAASLKRIGFDVPPELQALLRYGRGVDNRRFKMMGFRYGYTSAGALLAHVEEMRLRRTKGSEPGYRYEGELEEFLRRSPAVVRAEP
jgi:UDP-glucose 4-epimerase